METQRRGSDGRQLFSAEFKREQVARVLRKEITFAELSRELGMDQSVVRRWQHLVDRGCRTAVAADEEVVPASESHRTARYAAAPAPRQRSRAHVARPDRLVRGAEHPVALHLARQTGPERLH